MSDVAAGVFISYRRHETSWLAAWLHDRLVACFGEAQIFLDIDWIKPGVDFMQVILEAIARSRVLLVIIGPRWLSLDDEGGRRLDKTDDPVRMELESAFRRGLRVIPLLLDGAAVPRVEDLPDALVSLARLNALPVRYSSARTDLARLVEALVDELDISATPGWESVEPAAKPDPRPVWIRSAERIELAGVEDGEQRARLLRRLSRTYTEFLDQSLGNDAVLRLQVGLEWLEGKTVRPQDRLLPGLHRLSEPLQADTSLVETFDRAGGLDGDGLLILGEPGAGKTTLLFELGRQLTQRAQADCRHPVPVYLPLSNWAMRHLRLDQWLIEQLNQFYQVPRSLARRWIAGPQLLFMLDGLDEIPGHGDRTACLKAINRFNQFGRSTQLPLVVASRHPEYDTLSVRLRAETAVGVRSLNPAKVLSQLELAPEMNAVAAAVRRDARLFELLRSPLLVSMLTLTYARTSDGQPAFDAPPIRRQQLITEYVNRRLELDEPVKGNSRGRRDSYAPDRTRAWLSDMARYLSHHQQTVFVLGRLQPDWLPAGWARTVVLAIPGLIAAVILTLAMNYGLTAGGYIVGVTTGVAAWVTAGIAGKPGAARHISWSWARARAQLPVALVALLVVGIGAGPSTTDWGPVFALSAGLAVVVTSGLTGLRAGLVSGLLAAIIFGLSSGLGAAAIIGLSDGWGIALREGAAIGAIVGFAAGLTAGLVGQPEPTERLFWSWAQARTRLRIALIAGLGVALFVAILAATLTESMTATSALILGLFAGLLVALTAGLAGGLGRRPIPSYLTPNAGIRGSLQNGLIVTVLIGLIVGAISGLFLGLNQGLVLGLGAGLTIGLIFGLGAAVQYGILRLLLWGFHITPLQYVRWLNHAVRLRLLYRATNGGYIFIHRIVQDHFFEISRPSEDSMRNKGASYGRLATDVSRGRFLSVRPASWVDGLTLSFLVALALPIITAIAAAALLDVLNAGLVSLVGALVTGPLFGATIGLRLWRHALAAPPTARGCTAPVALGVLVGGALGGLASLAGGSLGVVPEFRVWVPLALAGTTAIVGGLGELWLRGRAGESPRVGPAAVVLGAVTATASLWAAQEAQLGVQVGWELLTGWLTTAGALVFPLIVAIVLAVAAGWAPRPRSLLRPLAWLDPAPDTSAERPRRDALVVGLCAGLGGGLGFVAYRAAVGAATGEADLLQRFSAIVLGIALVGALVTALLGLARGIVGIGTGLLAGPVAILTAGALYLAYNTLLGGNPLPLLWPLFGAAVPSGFLLSVIFSLTGLVRVPQLRSTRLICVLALALGAVVAVGVVAERAVLVPASSDSRTRDFYINEVARPILDGRVVETDALAKLKSENPSNADAAERIRSDVLPQATMLVQLAQSFRFDDPAAEAIHQHALNGANLHVEAYTLLATALDTNDSATFDEGNRRLTEGDAEWKEWASGAAVLTLPQAGELYFMGVASDLLARREAESAAHRQQIGLGVSALLRFELLAVSAGLGLSPDHPTDSTAAIRIRSDVLPQAYEILHIAQAYNSDDPDVQRVHNFALTAARTDIEGFTQMATAFDNNDKSLFDQANRRLAQGDAEWATWAAAAQALNLRAQTTD